MTGIEYKKIRKEVLGISQENIATALEVDVKTIGNRENDRYPVTKEAELALRQLVALKAKPPVLDTSKLTEEDLKKWKETLPQSVLLCRSSMSREEYEEKYPKQEGGES